MGKRIGVQTLLLPSQPFITAGASVVGKKEAEGPWGGCFDKVIPDEMNGQNSFELAERQLYLSALETCMEKGSVTRDKVQFMLGGDLLNQIICASYSARALAIPFLGLYGACSTMAESLCLGGMLVDGGFADNVLCAASSHFCTAERQYRFPLEFGSQRTPTAQWTVTGAGASLVSAAAGQKPLARIASVTIGRVIDMGVKDANNMGAAMAPAAADTLHAHLQDCQRTPEDYDLILTGDLGRVGAQLLLSLMQEKGMPLVQQKYTDCGLEIYHISEQDMHAGGSGCGCSATMLNGRYLPMLRSGELKRVLFMATGALLSPTSTQQGESIPGVAHAVELVAQ